MAARVYSLHSGAMLSDKSDCIVSTSKNFLSLVFVIQNYAIHIWEHTKGSLTLSGCFLLPACLWISHVCCDLFRIIENFATSFSWI